MGAWGGGSPPSMDIYDVVAYLSLLFNPFPVAFATAATSCSLCCCNCCLRCFAIFCVLYSCPFNYFFIIEVVAADVDASSFFAFYFPFASVIVNTATFGVVAAGAAAPAAFPLSFVMLFNLFVT